MDGDTSTNPFTSFKDLLLTWVDYGKLDIYAICVVAIIVGAVMCIWPDKRKAGKTTIIVAAVVAALVTSAVGYVMWAKSGDANKSQTAFTIIPLLKTHAMYYSNFIQLWLH